MKSDIKSPFLLLPFLKSPQAHRPMGLSPFPRNQNGPFTIAPIAAAGILGPDLVFEEIGMEIDILFFYSSQGKRKQNFDLHHLLFFITFYFESTSMPIHKI